MKEYILPGLEGFQWLHNKSRHLLAGQGLTTEQCDKLIDILRDVHLKDTHKNLNSLAHLKCFYIFQVEASAAIYLSEIVLSRNEATNMKYWSRLNTELEVTIQLSNIPPDFMIHTDSKQIHHLH